MDPFTEKRVHSILNGYIHVKIPARMRTSVQLLYEMRDHELTLREKRLSWDGKSWEMTDIAKFKLEPEGWKVYAKNRQQGNWLGVNSIMPNMDFENQLEQVERDPAGIFWPA
ncbi:DUF3024 domain-containing protein [Paenibacillus sp. VCA1]|uniref:DUF3024 domain-containing protein n=1 Tax=Paenibacillus sp. VCA1 TaxID=3039148 RepID=UPI002871A27E|nr:DUF3024 domain-containing protein [Paenibacillus sp. VCA1]MDR9855393.1 DUF3024 domain-containing protein [Paenibacillus sp. VCA1]